MRPKNVIAFMALALYATMSFAGFGGMANVGDEDAGTGPIGGPALVAMLIGAVIGYFIERAINASELRKRGAHDLSSYMLGGKVGAIVGAIAFPTLLGLMRS